MARHKSLQGTEPSVAFILGAGFSKCAELPLQSEFSKLLISDEFNSDLDRAITETLKEFLNIAFGWKEHRALPALEDLFTCIDLAANTGHTLGVRKYTPKVLRAVRRMAIHRIFSVLDCRFLYSADIDRLLNHLCQGDPSRCAFVVLNWDIVLENHILRTQPDSAIDYRCDCFDWHTSQASSTAQGIAVCKMHGSSNWVYCENCKSLFFDLERKLPLHLRAGLIKSDFRLFDEKFTDKVFDDALGITSNERNCRFCAFPVSSHIATFSYRKSFRTHAYPSVWYHAERLLAMSDRWIFVGYSLPEADFELKQILKAASLRMLHRKSKTKKSIEVIVLDDLPTQEKFERFFGTEMVKCFQKGIPEYISEL